MFDKNLIKQAQFLLDLAVELGIKIVSAESCTGGLIASLITAIPGSSQIFERGFVVYSNLAKQQNLQIDEADLNKYGAVSLEVARAMAIGAVANSSADLSIISTGIAGPDGATPDKVLGLVYLASYNKLNGKIICKEYHFDGDRDQIRSSSVELALQIIIDQIQILKINEI